MENQRVMKDQRAQKMGLKIKRVEARYLIFEDKLNFTSDDLKYKS